MVKLIFGSINIITVFLLLISFWLGIDFFIHLVKRFVYIIKKKNLSSALADTFFSTGKSVIISGLTTSIALLILGISGFRGISEFGFVGGLTLSMILIAIFISLPSIMVLGYRKGFISNNINKKTKIIFPKTIITFTILTISLVFFIFGITNLEFDYNFDHLEPKSPKLKRIKQYNEQVYPSTLVPQAIYISADLSSLDEMSAILHHEKEGNPETNIGWIRSIRDFYPNDNETEKRLRKLKEIKNQLNGKWIKRIKDKKIVRWISFLSKTEIPERKPKLEELPQVLTRNLITTGGEKKYIIAVYPDTSINHGKDAMNFTKEIYKINNPKNTMGPKIRIRVIIR